MCIWCSLCLLQVEVASGSVSCVAGTGVQGSDKEGGGKGGQQAISSPWDLALGHSPGEVGCVCGVEEAPAPVEGGLG